MADGSVGVPAESLRAIHSTERGQMKWALLDRRTVLLLLGPIVLVTAFLWFFLTGGRYVSTDNSYVERDLVQISTDVSGIVREIDVVDNQRVEAGQLLFKLDDASFRFAVDNAQAQLALARNEVEQQKASWHEKGEEVKLARVDLDFAQRDWARRHDLFEQHVVPQATMDLAQQALDGAKQRLQTAQQQVAVATAALGGDVDLPTDRQPRVLAAMAQLDEAQRSVSHAIVRAPAAGIVTNVPNLQLGRFLPASMAAFGLVSSEDAWVQANPKETELTWVRPGQKVKITVDTYPGVEWEGTVASLSPASSSQFAILPAQNTSGNWVKVVQRNPIRVAVTRDPNKPDLRAGMSAEISIDTEHRRTLSDLGALIGL